MYSTRAVHIPCTVKAMRQLTCTDRPYKATTRLALAPKYSTYCMLAVQRKVPYARRCSYSSVATTLVRSSRGD